ncbi:Hsp70 family protein, partial [Actinoplanes sp. NPDC051633]|uniref:Hsp70 family protein n=1 Tax=Actinoplanes sp. NPDC051633 TaxID=3155670 RepID=UPI0034460DCA
LFKRSMGSTTFQLPLGGRDWTPIQLSAEVLKHLKAQAETALGRPVTSAVITVPEYFTHPERDATIKAGELAGLTVPRIISEPTAAALAYGLRPSPQDLRRVMVYDLGGGTFDISLVEISPGAIRVIGSKGNHELGGRDWDDRLGEVLLRNFPAEADALADNPTALLVEIERLKRTLSARQTTEVRLHFDGRELRCQITRAEFEAATRDLLEMTGRLADRVLEETGLTWEQIDGVLPVGGSTRMPMVRDLIEKRGGRPPMGGVHPDQAVALGAAAQAAILIEEQGATRLRLGTARPGDEIPLLRLTAPRTIVDVVAHSLGMIAEHESGERYINSVLLARNGTIPCTETKPYQFRVKGDGTDEMEVFLTQGETDDPEPCAYLGRYLVTGFPSGGSRDTVVDVSYAYDENAIVGVTAVDRSSGAPLRVTVMSLPEDIPGRFLLPPPRRRTTRVPMTIYLAFDVSGSMAGRPIAEAKTAARSFVSQLDLTSTSIGLIEFSDKLRVTQQATHNAVEIEAAISRLSVGSTGYGNATHPFDELHSLLQQQPGRRFGVVLADGVWERQEHAVKRAVRCHQEKIEIVAVGFGGADQGFLRRIASSSEQAMFTSMEGLSDVFGTIARELTEGDGSASSALRMR